MSGDDNRQKQDARKQNQTRGRRCGWKGVVVDLEDRRKERKRKLLASQSGNEVFFPTSPGGKDALARKADKSATCTLGVPQVPAVPETAVQVPEARPAPNF